jgi:hypothetical protein
MLDQTKLKNKMNPEEKILAIFRLDTAISKIANATRKLRRTVHKDVYNEMLNEINVVKNKIIELKKDKELITKNKIKALGSEIETLIIKFVNSFFTA